MTTLAHTIDIVEQVQWPMLAAGNILHQAHHEAILAADVDHNRRDRGLTKFTKRFQASLAANQVIADAIKVWAGGDRNRALETLRWRCC